MTPRDYHNTREWLEYVIRRPWGYHYDYVERCKLKWGRLTTDPLPEPFVVEEAEEDDSEEGSTTAPE